MKILGIYLLGCLVSLTMTVGINLIMKGQKLPDFKKYILAYIIYILLSWVGVISNIVLGIIALWKKLNSRQ